MVGFSEPVSRRWAPRAVHIFTLALQNQFYALGGLPKIRYALSGARPGLQPVAPQITAEVPLRADIFVGGGGGVHGPKKAFRRR